MATGTDSVALVMSQKENQLRQERAESLDESVIGGYMPVFEAFNELGLTGCDVAEVADVTPPTVSKWRKGKVRIPNDRLVFLTLVLAHLLDDIAALTTLESEWSPEGGGGDWCRAESARIDAARAQLSMQDVLNRDLPVSDVRDGAKRFRTWWSSGAAAKLQEKRFKLALGSGGNRELEILKARVKRS